MMTALERLQQKMKDGTLRLSRNQNYLTAVHEAGHAVGSWAVSCKILAKLQRCRERFQRTGLGRIIRRIPDLPPKFQVVLRTPDEVEAGLYRRRSGGEIACQGIVDMEEMELDTRFELSPGERARFYAVGLLTGPIAEMFAATSQSDDWLRAAAGYEIETLDALDLARDQYSNRHIGETQKEKLIVEAHEIIVSHWAAIEALAVKLTEKNLIEGEEAIAIIEAAEQEDQS